MKCSIRDFNHKLRTPIAGIIGSLKMLEQSELSASQIEYIKNIEKCSNNLLDSIESLTKSFLVIKNTCKPNLRILLVEDQPILQKATQYLLEQKGHTVCVAENGLVALEKFSNGYDVIFMDIRMPRMDGFATTKAIRQLATGKQIPIIALTAEGSTIKDECIKVGMDEVLMKPFNDLELNNLLHRISSNKQSFKSS